VPVLSGGVVSVALALAPFDGAELDVCELGAAGEAAADLDVVPGTLGLAVLVGVGDEVTQGCPAVLVLRGALTLEVADAVVLALCWAALLGGVLVTLAVGVLVTLAPSLGPASSLVGLLPVPPLAGLDTAGADGTLGVADLLVFAAADAEVAAEHVVAVAPGWPMAVLPWPMPPFDEPSRVPGPGWFCVPPVPVEVIPTC